MFKGQAITFGRLHTWTLSFYFQKAKDHLTIRSPWSADGTWVSLPDNVSVKVDPQTGEAVEFEIAEIGSGTTKTTASIALDLKDTYGQFSVLRHTGKGVVRSR